MSVEIGDICHANSGALDDVERSLGMHHFDAPPFRHVHHYRVSCIDEGVCVILRSPDVDGFADVLET